MIDFEDTLSDEGYPIRRRVKLSKPKRVPTKHKRHDPEMGVFPLLAAAIPMVTSLAGSLLSKSSSSGGGPPPEAAQAQGVLDILTKAIGGDDGQVNIKQIVKDVVSTIPSPVMDQVKKAITELKNAEKAGIETRNGLVNAVDAKFQPQITAMLAALKADQLQKQATYEHNRIKERELFRDATTQSLLNIGKRLDNIEARLSNSAIVKGPRIELYGGRSVLERG